MVKIRQMVILITIFAMSDDYTYYYDTLKITITLLIEKCNHLI